MYHMYYSMPGTIQVLQLHSTHSCSNHSPEFHRPTDILNSPLINLLKPNVYGMHQQVNILTTVLSAHTVFMCFVFV
jgi:hypothetical protein